MSNIDPSLIYTEENRAILRKYMAKFYGKEKAAELYKKYRGKWFEKGNVAYALGSKSLEFFCKFYLSGIFTPKPDNLVRELATVHYDIWDELTKMFVLDEWDKELFILPRGSSKSTTINVALSTWANCYKKSRFTVVIANRELDSVNFVEKTKTALQTPAIEYTFGKLVNPKNRTVNKLELETDNDCKIMAYSSGTSVRGTSYICKDGIFRPTLFILDDFTSEDDILSDSAKQKVLDKFYKEISEAGDRVVVRNGKKIKSASKFLILGTPLSQDDFINTIRKDVDFRVFHRSVVDFDVDEYFENHPHWQEFKRILFDDKLDDSRKSAFQYYNDNKEHMEFHTLWEKYECADLAKDYFNKRVAFMQELMCDCQNIGDKWFKSNRVQTLEEIEEHNFIKTMLCIDTAGVKNKDKRKSDSFGFVVGSLADNDFKYVRTAQLRKFNEFDQYIFHVITLLKDFPDITHVFVEKNLYTGLDVERIEQEIQKIPELQKRKITFINEMQRRNKDEKISTIVSDTNNGRIIFCSDRVEKDFLHQVMEFAGQKYSLHDDAPDVLSEFVNRIDEIEVIRPVKFAPRDWLF